MTDEEYRQCLATQLAMNRMTWEVLQGHGVTEQTQVRLDFAYDAPNKKKAETLAAFLHEETDYDVSAKSYGSILRREWTVEGTTQNTIISPEILDQWVTWMVTAGKEHSCIFDGWGTPVGENSPNPP